LEPNEFSRATLQQATEGISIDYKRVLYRAWRYWYFILGSLIITVSIAFVKNRYAPRIYPVSASIIVKETEDISGSEFVYNNALVNLHRNYINETYIIKSYPLIQRVVEKLNFDVAFYTEGKILTTEIYDELPFLMIPMRAEMTRGTSFFFSVVNENQFELTMNTDKQRFAFNDTINFHGFKGIAQLKDRSLLSTIFNNSYIFVYTPSVQAASRYVGGLSASWAEEDAGVLNLSVLGSNTKKELDFMAGLITTYQEFDLDNKNETALRTVNFITNQLKSISDSLIFVEGKLEKFKSKNTGVDIGGEALRLYNKLEEVEEGKMQLMVRENYFKYLVSYIKNGESVDQVILPNSMGVEDPILSGVISKIMDAQLELKLNNHPANPLVSESRKRMTQLKSSVLESVNTLRSTDAIKLNFLQKQIKGIENQLSYLPTTERNLISIQRNYSLLENLYIYLLQKKSEAAISQASNTSDIVVVNPPRVGGAISPKTTSNYAIAVFAGLAIPMIIFILFEFLDTRVQSKEDVERITNIPFIGGVGHKNSDTNLAVFSQPKSIISESFRALRSNLNYFIGKNEKTVVLVTSSISGEGKTFTSLNLASVYALSGKKTLIVGADMRKPKLYADFNVENDIGLSNYLAGIADFKSICKKTEYENLDLITGGVIPPNPSELLLSQRMTAFITDAKQHYDCIIIDTPPMAIVTDAFVLTPFADHTLFLVRQNYTPKNLLRTVEDYYATGKLKNISIVLNDIYRSGPGYGFGYGYAYGYGYTYGYMYGRKQDPGAGYYEEERK